MTAGVLLWCTGTVHLRGAIRQPLLRSVRRSGALGTMAMSPRIAKRPSLQVWNVMIRTRVRTHLARYQDSSVAG